MAKVQKSISGAVFPTPVVLATTAANDGRPNIITLAWVGIICSEPLMIGASIRPSRHSHSLLDENPEIVINVPRRSLLEKVDACGTASGREVDKFTACGLTALPADTVSPPLIAECPINLECRVADRLSLGSHDYYLCLVLKTHVDEDLLDDNGRLAVSRLEPFSYIGMDYYALTEKIGHYGYTKRS